MSSQRMLDDASSASSPRSQTRGVLMAAAMIIVAVVLAYSNTLSVPFLFDDQQAICQNQSIRPPLSAGALLIPPGKGAAVQRRPVTNVSLAVNYAISGLEPWSYHVFNLLIHVLAALLLLAIVRRTLLRVAGTVASPGHESDHLADNSLLLATLISLIWAIHPLVTEAVTYTIQRTEELAAFFYLLTLYCVIRGASARRSTPWYALAAASCALAMGSKESAVSAPLVVLLYDRVFLSASWREIFRRRWGLYVTLAGSWAIAIVLLPHGREGAAPFGHGSQAVQYAAAQFGVIVHYLRLCFWPSPLVLDYGIYSPQTAGQIAPYAAMICILVVGIILAFRYQPWLGFLGVAFFAILAPSSSVVPIFQQVAAEKRMYLPLATVVIAVVMSVYMLTRKLHDRRWPSPGEQPESVRRIEVGLLGALLVLLGCMTYVRNHDYRAAATLWEDTVRKCPRNARAQTNLAVAYENFGLTDVAADYYRAAIELDPKHAIAHRNLGRIMARSGKVDEGLQHLKKAVTFAPDDAEAETNLGTALLSVGQAEAAISHLNAAIKLDPKCAEAHNSLGSLLMRRGKTEQAIAQFRMALTIKPGFAAANRNLERALADQKRSDSDRSEKSKRP